MKQIVLKTDESVSIHELVLELIDFGYEKSEGLLHSGQFSVIGGTLRVFPVNNERSYAVEFFGNTIERVYSYDQESGKKIANEFAIEITVNRLVLEDKSVAKPGDYLVHEDYGIGQFESLEKKIVDGEELIYINLRYYNNDLLRILLDQSGRLTRYIGVGKRHPKLSKLGSTTWQKTYKKTYENIILVAKELLKLYAQREIIYKKPRAIHEDWKTMISSSFGFQETVDQEKAIDDIYSDLQRSCPTDRLICGDVGFGKTEVAVRAAAQVVANGYQVAILVPTTILAEQHFVMLSKRFQGLPVNIARLSRFVSATDALKTKEEVSLGKIDIIVGTHSILQKSLSFKNLGLLVVDEEQKFGVKDKEKLKQLKSNIDVLTLTATPIPRTLYMALSGIRGISQISSIPIGRKSIDTNVKKYDEDIVREYIDRELARNGQIYYLHNSVQSIQSVKRNLLKKYPNACVEIAHGQMGEGQLADVMRHFSLGEIQILVCSTIIENGLDLANANTLIVDESDKFGLSQLYQIRGRIGRSINQSYALFTYKNKILTTNARKRLSALVENTELGTGYSIALEDLEIRGGGNILGREQHGNMEAIGLLLYSKLLQAAVKQMKSE
jgi:transcription-repair coupling factor (superfamily II helicase)